MLSGWTPLRAVALKFHVVAKATAEMPFPADELGLLYETAGINLALVEGERIDYDPTYYWINYSDLVQKFGENDRNAGHLIIGLAGPDHRKDIAGQLLDLESRGVAVVYTSCDYIRRDGESARLQTCAHEIGHMLNLSHKDVASTFVSTMDQAEKRDIDASLSWKSVIVEAEEVRNAQKPDYFSPPARELKAYPFSYQARFNLNTLSPDRLLPWGGKFEHPYDQTNDTCCHV